MGCSAPDQFNAKFANGERAMPRAREVERLLSQAPDLTESEMCNQLQELVLDMLCNVLADKL